MWEFGEDDPFVPGATEGCVQLFLSPWDDSSSSYDSFLVQPPPDKPSASVSSPGWNVPYYARDPQGLVRENLSLREMERSLREARAIRAAQNESLKRQLEECKSRFRSALCKGTDRLIDA
jgi:hypothetical protein